MSPLKKTIGEEIPCSHTHKLTHELIHSPNCQSPRLIPSPKHTHAHHHHDTNIAGGE